MNILSTTPIWADEAGTKEPICAISTMRAVCRSRADLPGHVGPGDHHDLLRRIVEINIVGDILLPHVHERLDDGVAALADIYHLALGEFRGEYLRSPAMTANERRQSARATTAASR